MSNGLNIWDSFYNLKGMDSWMHKPVDASGNWSYNGKKYDINKLAKALKSDPAVSGSGKYKMHSNCQIESTMSCNRSEALNWMRHYMGEAIARGVGNPPDQNLRAMFLAAYDTYTSLKKGE